MFRDEIPCVLEINARPGYRGLLKANGVNAAEEMVAYAAEKAQDFA